jgi:hypothetical protein
MVKKQGSDEYNLLSIFGLENNGKSSSKEIIYIL